MGAQILESAGAEVPARRWHHDPHTSQALPVSARSQTPRSFPTAIQADLGESAAYKQALLRGEIGLQRPMGANVQGVDFITAVRDGAAGIKEILCTDVKTSLRGQFPTPKQTMPGSWYGEVSAAIHPARLQLRVVTTDVASAPLHPFTLPQTPMELTALEHGIVQAVHQHRIRLRQLHADYSEAGQGLITGW
jgi:hypothetical protein